MRRSGKWGQQGTVQADFSRILGDGLREGSESGHASCQSLPLFLQLPRLPGHTASWERVTVTQPSTDLCSSTFGSSVR